MQTISFRNFGVGTEFYIDLDFRKLRCLFFISHTVSSKAVYEFLVGTCFEYRADVEESWVEGVLEQPVSEYVSENRGVRTWPRREL